MKSWALFVIYLLVMAAAFSYQNCSDINLKNKNQTPTQPSIPEIYDTKIINSLGTELYASGNTGGTHGLTYFRACHQPCSYQMFLKGQCSLATIGADNVDESRLLNPATNPMCDLIQYLKPGESKSLLLTPDLSQFCRSAGSNRYCTQISAYPIDERDYRYGTERNEVANSGPIFYQLSLSQVAGKFAKISEMSMGDYVLSSQDKCDVIYASTTWQPAFGLTTTDKAENPIKNCFLKLNTQGQIYLNMKIVEAKDLPLEFFNKINLPVEQSRCYQSQKGCSVIFEMRTNGNPI